MICNQHQTLVQLNKHGNYNKRWKIVEAKPQGSRKCGSMEAAHLGNGRPIWGNDATWEKEKKKEEKKERKNDKWGMRKKDERKKKGEEGKKRKDNEDKIFLKIIE